MKLCYFFLLLLLPLAAPAQTRKLTPKDLPPSAFKLIAIKVTGNHRYTSEEITEATGLKLGQTVGFDDYKTATERLGNTGAFTNVGYTYEYSNDGTRLTFQVTEAANLLPARFDNIVWYSDQELLAKLRARVPLFDGQLPEGGNLADKVSDALQALMDEHNVHGGVDYVRSGEEGGPINAVVYSITGPDIRVRNIDFAGADAAELPLLLQAAKPLRGGDYLRSVLRVKEDKDLLPVYLARGYLKASFADAQAKVAEDTPSQTLVDVTFPVTPGLQYKVTGVELSGETVFPATQLQPMIHLPAGQPANANQLQEDLGAIRKLYGTKGYMAVAFHPTPQMDDTQATVKYLIAISEGAVYKMGDLTIKGLDTRTTARLQEAWQLRGGDPYDSSYPARFLKETAQEVEGMGQWNIRVREEVDDRDQEVDVTIHYDPKLH